MRCGRTEKENKRYKDGNGTNDEKEEKGKRRRKYDNKCEKMKEARPDLEIKKEKINKREEGERGRI